MPNATVRANARTLPKARRPVPTGKDFVDDVSYLPDRYAMPVFGDCLEPEIHSGAVLLFDKTQPYKVGDLVVVFRRHEATPEGQFQAMVKRLIMAPPHWVTAFPFNDHPQSDVLAIVGLEMLNPRRRFTMRCADILGIHKCLGVASPEMRRVTMQIPAGSVR